MKFLIDNMLSVLLADELGKRGQQAVHVRSLGLDRAPDSVLLARAREDGCVVISADRDFGGHLAQLKAEQPSVIYLRGALPRDPRALAELLCRNLDRLASALHEGSIVVIEPSRIRIRRLPIR